MGDSLQEGKHHENPISSKPLNAAFVFDHARTLAAQSRTVRINPQTFQARPQWGRPTRACAAHDKCGVIESFTHLALMRKMMSLDGAAAQATPHKAAGPGNPTLDAHAVHCCGAMRLKHLSL